MMQSALTPVIFLMAFSTAISNGEQVTFYEHTHFRGESITTTLTGKECVTLPDNWFDRTASLNTHDNCIIAWSFANCTASLFGRNSERIAPGTPYHYNLEEINFDADIRSIRLCSGPAEATSARWIGVREHDFKRSRHHSPLLKGDNETLHQAAQRKAQFFATSISIISRFSGSQNWALEVKASSEEDAVRNAVRSWYEEEFHYDYSNPGLSRGTYHFTTLVWKEASQVGIGVAWNSTRDTYAVVAYYDSDGNGRNFEENVVPEYTYNSDPIIFYQHQNYEGEELRLYPIGGCHKLPESWGNNVTSVKINVHRIVAWDTRGCYGNLLNITESVNNLNDVNFNNVIGSFNLYDSFYNS